MKIEGNCVDGNLKRKKKTNKEKDKILGWKTT